VWVERRVGRWLSWREQCVLGLTAGQYNDYWIQCMEVGDLAKGAEGGREGGREEGRKGGREEGFEWM
jgi:hypothetical protein